MKSVEERKSSFIEKAIQIHGNLYDYSEIEYKDNRTPVKIIDKNCPENPVFWQTPCNHLKGQGNPFYRNSKISETKHMKWDALLIKLKDSHPNENLEYPEQVVKNFHDKIRIIDHDLRPDGTEYGEYIQEVNAHLKGSGHPDKGREKMIMSQRTKNEEYVRRVMKVHEGKNYDYSLIDYQGNTSHIKVICNEIGGNGKPHGLFITMAGNFLCGKGCPKCGNHTSKAEDEISEFIESLGFKVEHRVRFEKKYEIDVYVPEKHFAIEFDGLRWHCEARGKDMWYHFNKSQFCNENDINLMHVFEDEWLYHKDTVKFEIIKALGIEYGSVIDIAKCEVKKVDDEQCDKFLDEYDLHGKAISTVKYGVYYENNLISTMCFKKEHENGVWTIIRYCTNPAYSYYDNFGWKMLDKFIKENNVNILKASVDRRFSFDKKQTNLYTNFGFVLDAIENPDYCYTNGHGKRLNKCNFIKTFLEKDVVSEITGNNEKTEQLGYSKIWDCGLIKYIYRNPNVPQPEASKSEVQ